MAAPPIDPRTAQDLVDEAKRRIPLYCPEWTDHNVSDPGVTLIELFAFMVDVLLYRLNKVSDRDYLKFLELIGARPRPAVPAETELTFWLTTPPTERMRIPRGTEVATQQIEGEQVINFTTDEELFIEKPQLAYVVLGRNSGEGPDGYVYEDASERLGWGDAQFQVFQDPPADPDPPGWRRPGDPRGDAQLGDCFYLGFAERRGAALAPQKLAGHALRVQLNCQRLGGSNVRAEDPPLSWEFWTGAEWANLQLGDDELATLRQTDQELDRIGRRLDSTLGLNQPGTQILVVPRSAASRTLPLGGHNVEAFWIRCRAARRDYYEHFYNHSPILNGISVESIGGQVLASHAAVIPGEDLGRSDGTPGQTFLLRRSPVLPRQTDGDEPETLVVLDDRGQPEPWTEVETFAHSDAASSHFSIDPLSGEISLGPRLQLAGGEDRQYGRVPPKGRMLRFTHYRTGGGKEGNVGRGKLVILKSAAKLAYVKWACNLIPATGGRDRETVDEYRLRGPELVRTRDVAITRDDFVKLALRASPKIARVSCVGAVAGAPPAKPNVALPPAPVTGDALDPGGNGHVSPWARRAQLPVMAETVTPPPPPSNGQGATGTLPCVQLALVPSVAALDRVVPAEELYLSDEHRRELFTSVREFLEDRCPLTTELSIHLADYRWVAVRAALVVDPRPDLDVASLQTLRAAMVEEARLRLFRFIHPVTGGPDGDGWPFGRSLTLGDLYPLLESLDGVSFVRSIEVRAWTGATVPDLATIAPEERVRLGPTEVLCSGDHHIDLVELSD